MFETWKLMDFTPGAGREQEVFQAGFDDSGWLDINAPGDVHRALIAAGRIPDPFYDRNETEAAWMEQREFWYRARFQAGSAPDADERVLLVFHGLDTYAVLYLNGKLLGRSQNMFHESLFDVSRKLEWGKENTLAVRFDPPLRKLDPNNPFKSTWGRNPERVFMRKAQFGYGWDWGPRLPTIGIWRPVELKRYHTGALLGVHFATLRVDMDPNPGHHPPRATSALAMVRLEAARFTENNTTPLKVEIRLSAPGAKKPLVEQTISLDQPGSLQSAAAHYTLPAPRLWWTNDLGEPYLYDLRVTLRQGKTILDRTEQQVGVRTLALDQSPDPEEPGTRFFRFVLNGIPVFAKGANWIPADSFVGAIPDARYERLLEMAHAAHMNMLRVWGGGIYEHDSFYNLCDRLGLLVWQDFMFACAMYPENDQSFIASVDAEARYQVRRLRSHACLALWCGNNENQWIHDRTFPEHPEQLVPGALYYDHILPDVVREQDGFTPYWLSSPYGGSDYNSMEDGDRHNWQVWHGSQPRRFGEPNITDRSPEGVSYHHYAEDSGRFISEFGMHAAPVFETLRRVIPEDQRYHHSPSMDHHNKDNPKNKGDALMETVTGLPEGLEQYIDFSMIAQAEGLKFGIEHFRRRMPHCSGALIWQLNDCWPVLSWSLVDYYGFGKAGYYYTARVFAPVLASFKEEPEGAVSLWVTNDRLADVIEAVVVRLARFSGDLIWEEKVMVDVPANSSRGIALWESSALNPAPDCYLTVRSEAGTFPANRHFFVPVKDLRRESPAPEVQWTSLSAHALQAKVSAPAYVYFFHLIHPSEFTRYEDNYFDLEPGETRTIRVWNDQMEIKPEEFGVKSL
ncbi:MAG TPA: glycoside hydrolase family 2 protein [Anaerolineaceae bacterium]